MAATPETIGDYNIVKELGRGAMGVVYLAIHPSLGRELALKVMAKDLANDPDFLERFRREGEAASKLRHPNIVQVFDFAHRDGKHFIAMEYLGSTTLKDLLDNSGKQSVEDSCRMIDELLSALELAHSKGIVHRDIKPANIMLTDAGPIALTDFSIAHMKETSKLTQTGAIIGTPEYMAPEQFDGVWDGRSDIYAAATVLYELLTGISPFRADTISEVMRKQLLSVPDPPAIVDALVPEAISQVVSKALEKDPENRYQSADGMRRALACALHDATNGADDNEDISSVRTVTPAVSPPIATPSIAVSVSPEETSRKPMFSPKKTPQAPISEADAGALSASQALPAPPLNADRNPVSVEGSVDSKHAWQRTAGLAMMFLAIVLALVLWWRMEHEKGRESPTPANPMSAPVAVEFPPPSQPSQPPVAPESSQPPPVPPKPKSTSLFPKKAYIAPGVGVGDLGLGVGKQKVRAAWGEPVDGQSQDGMTRWAYGAPGEMATTGVYFNRKGVVELIAVATPDFTIAGSPDSRVGASYSTILAAFPKPSRTFPTGLDYRDQGIYFLFKDDKCYAIFIYSPGRVFEKLEMF